MKQVTQDWLSFALTDLKSCEMIINEVYLASRYPGHFGLLADGKPTIKEAKTFYKTAKDIFYSIRAELERI